MFIFRCDYCPFWNTEDNCCDCPNSGERCYECLEPPYIFEEGEE